MGGPHRKRKYIFPQQPKNIVDSELNFIQLHALRAKKTFFISNRLLDVIDWA